MKYQIRDKRTGDIVDRDLSYEEALMWVDNSNSNRYTILKMDSCQGED